MDSLHLGKESPYSFSKFKLLNTDSMLMQTLSTWPPQGLY